MEKLMQFVWQHRLALTSGMKCVDGAGVRVVDQGRLNEDAGPDFFNATVEIGGETWVGNIEIHVRASDWYRHGHHDDPAYDTVILHVVGVDDMPVKRRDGSVIPQLVIRCTPEAARRCNMLVANSVHSLPCFHTIKAFPQLHTTAWITALAYERLYAKSDRFASLAAESGGDWAYAGYVLLARALGFGLNSQPFEQLAMSLPPACLRKHADDQDACEAMVFGQAGLIPEPADDEEPYVTSMRQNYRFFAGKFSLKCTRPSWKMGRTRPQNLPYKRLAYLAQFMCYSDGFIEELEMARNLDDLCRVFDHPLIGFWSRHYTFAPTATDYVTRAMSDTSVEKLVVNVAIPLLHARALARGDIDRATALADVLTAASPEDNRLTRVFTNAGLPNRSAFESQALIHLRKEYCERNKCIYCRFGHRMLSAEITRDT